MKMDIEEHNTSFIENVAAAAVVSSSVISKDHEVQQHEEEEEEDDKPTTTTTTTTTTGINSGNHPLPYQPRTIRAGSTNSERRAELLPAYPLAKNSKSHVLLLLSNVPNVDREKCENESFCGGHGFCPFEFKQHHYIEQIDSFMIDLFQDLFIEPSRQWKIHYSLIDYNLSRLRKCMDLYTEQTGESAISSFHELPTALEFFLQIDVDLFFMKTCNFRGAHPRLSSYKNATNETEGILCQFHPRAHYDMKPCCSRNCYLCESRYIGRGGGGGGGSTVRGIDNDSLFKTGIHFCSNQIHRFVNKYEAILNCHANCTTSNIIYTLTCPCGQYDYIDSTSSSFYDRILKHRHENNRIIREFLIGLDNIHHILGQASQSAETLANNDMRVYQHSPRCSLVLQHFLDHNSDYCCLVPMSYEEARADDNIYASTSSADANAVYMATARVPPNSPTFTPKPLFFQEVLKNTTRSREECIWLSKGLPKPPSGYRFSHRQIDQQLDFFKFKKEATIRSSHLVDCYKYTIVAVLPEGCSHELRRFIEALFITHAETKLNVIGRLTHKGPWPSSATSFDHSKRGLWCEKLVRCSSHT